MQIRLGHSPDSDDAFMFYGLASGAVDTGRYQISHVLGDIQGLNERACRGELEITAISAAAYPAVREHYDLTRCGGSFGDNYGPMVVAARPMNQDELADQTIAIPGAMTSAYLALRLWRAGLKTVVMPFDQILPAVADGQVAAGLIIHEGQLTFARAGLHLVVDLGQWWHGLTGAELGSALPLPLGLNAVRRDLGPQAPELARILAESIQYSLDHRQEAVRYALQFARGMPAELADRFVGMYVNDLTVNCGRRGVRGIEEFLRRGHAAGLVENALPVRFVASHKIAWFSRRD